MVEDVKVGGLIMRFFLKERRLSDATRNIFFLFFFDSKRVKIL